MDQPAGHQHLTHLCVQVIDRHFDHLRLTQRRICRARLNQTMDEIGMGAGVDPRGLRAVG